MSCKYYKSQAWLTQSRFYSYSVKGIRYVDDVDEMNYCKENFLSGVNKVFCQQIQLKAYV